MKILLLTGCAGFIGTVLRYLCLRCLDGKTPGFPGGTLAVNILGAFIAGCMYWIFKDKWSAYSVYSPIVFTGFLGAFTTFSAFTLDSLKLLEDGHAALFFVNIVVMNLAGLAAAGAGMLLFRAILH